MIEQIINLHRKIEEDKLEIERLISEYLKFEFSEQINLLKSFGFSEIIRQQYYKGLFSYAYDFNNFTLQFQLEKRTHNLQYSIF